MIESGNAHINGIQERSLTSSKFKLSRPYDARISVKTSKKLSRKALEQLFSLFVLLCQHRHQRNGLETQAKVLMTSVIQPDTLYFRTL